MRHKQAAPAMPPEILDETRNAFRARVRLLRRYISALTVKPADPLEVVHAVAHDLTEIALVYGGSFPRACGDAANETDKHDAQDAAHERANDTEV